MPWGWECRQRLIKQVPLAPTERRLTGNENFQLPGPNQYETPKIFCGDGYSNIKRAPAYTMRPKYPYNEFKPVVNPNAPQFDISGFARKGKHRIIGSVIGEQFDPPGDKTNRPGPKYKPKSFLKRAPAYSIRKAAKPPYQSWDMWTPSPNMYLPPIPSKRAPAFSMEGRPGVRLQSCTPGPGSYDPKYEQIIKKEPTCLIGNASYEAGKIPSISPAPNAYCIKNPLATKPGQSFGIRHSRFMGKPPVYLKPSNLDLTKGITH